MKRHLFFILSVLLTAWGGHRTTDVSFSGADRSIVTDSMTAKDSLSMVEEENKLLKTLLPDLYSRKFPTAEEMKMWNLLLMVTWLTRMCLCWAGLWLGHILEISIGVRMVTMRRIWRNFLYFLRTAISMLLVTLTGMVSGLTRFMLRQFHKIMARNMT